MLDMLAVCEAEERHGVCGCVLMCWCVCMCQQEDDVLDMLAECEAEEHHSVCGCVLMCLCVYQQEEDVLDMLAECEAEEHHSVCGCVLMCCVFVCVNRRMMCWTCWPSVRQKSGTARCSSGLRVAE